MSKKITNIKELSLEEIQEYLFDGHSDKFTTKPDCLTCKNQEDYEIIKLKNKTETVKHTEIKPIISINVELKTKKLNKIIY